MKGCRQGSAVAPVMVGLKPAMCKPAHCENTLAITQLAASCQTQKTSIQSHQTVWHAAAKVCNSCSANRD